MFNDRKESEISMKVCSDNWTDTWSNFVCQSLGFTETKTTNFRTNENSTENFVGYLKLKDNSTLNSSKSLTGYLEPASTSCETVEIKCSSKHRKSLFCINLNFCISMFTLFYSVWRFWRQRSTIHGNMAFCCLPS